MKIKKKITIIGPAGTGKTTIKKVYFEMANPLKILEFSLKPTKGINSSVYSLFKINTVKFLLSILFPSKKTFLNSILPDNFLFIKILFMPLKFIINQTH